MSRTSATVGEAAPQGRIAVIGAGPAGLSAAYALSKAGRVVDVYEAGPAVGGMSKTIELWGQLVDLGPHRFFSTDPRVNRVWHEVVAGDYSMVDRLTRIYYRRRFFKYPLKAFDALAKLGLFEALRCLASYGVARLRPLPDESTFENWVVNRFGRRLFEIFFKSYSEKLWGITCQELDADFAAQRIKRFSLLEAIRSALLPSRKRGHKTLVDCFAYPSGGTGMVYERMAAFVVNHGGRVHLKTRVASVRPAADGGPVSVGLVGGGEYAYAAVVSTMPLTALVASMQPPPLVRQACERLRFRNTILVYVELEGESPFPDQWIYVHAKELGAGRITNFANWVPTLRNGLDASIVCLEYWCFDADPIWGESDDHLVERAKEELLSTGLVSSKSLRRGAVTRLHMSYPVYDHGYREHVAVLRGFLQQCGGIHPIGRYGAFKYNNQDHSILMGLLVAENIAAGAAHDLWTVNTDYEYQESGPVTACAGNGGS